MVGGTIGKKRESNKKVVIGIGLGKFATNTKLTPLHSSFSAYFVGKVCSLDYLVVGVNTSKRYPNCKGSGTHPTDFVGSITIRQLFCRQCKTYFHRDEMAASNMVNAICSQTQNNKRPNYLLPIDKSGKFVVRRQSTSEITPQDQPETQTSESETDSKSSVPRRKRKAEPEARTLRKRHQTYESEADSESDSSWQSSEEEGEEGEDDDDGEEDYEEEDYEEEDVGEEGYEEDDDSEEDEKEDNKSWAC